MPAVCVFEDSLVERLYPLTYARAACELRVGALTLLERMRRNLGLPLAGLMVRSGALAEVVRGRMGGEVPVNMPVSTKEGLLLINSRWLMFEEETGGMWEVPAADAAGLSGGTIVWMHLSAEQAGKVDLSKLHEARTLEAFLPVVRREASEATVINRAWDLLAHQRAAIEEDFAALGAVNNEAVVIRGAHVLEEKNVHLGAGVKVWPGAVLDASGGPIIVGEGTEIRANAVITGPVVIGAHCVVRSQADIREETTLGPGCRVGGEVIGSIFLGNVNKQHYGFAGQTIVGEWANLGAGTTTSNMKNTYGLVKVPVNGRDEPTGRQFMGAVIGDHAKLGIGTYLSTGSMVGFGSHVVVGRPPRFVPSFAWVTEKGVARAEFEKIERIAATVMKRRGTEFTATDHALFVQIASEWSQAEQYTWANS
jgi:UDP-N-acetylglucosamine diphosphorylase / glucose-1-phosphate thymidylyltransferase / UDP-N-acetylgalactosamine diphosphorylase / glucosamine-1-phosphate N-acetyltransferase / galactosamine-1-phosphate N-acetyltransferase